jgi:hypothetical protein
MGLGWSCYLTSTLPVRCHGNGTQEFLRCSELRAASARTPRRHRRAKGGPTGRAPTIMAFKAFVAREQSSRHCWRLTVSSLASAGLLGGVLLAAASASRGEASSKTPAETQPFQHDRGVETGLDSPPSVSGQGSRSTFSRTRALGLGACCRPRVVAAQRAHLTQPSAPPRLALLLGSPAVVVHCSGRSRPRRGDVPTHLTRWRVALGLLLFPC